MKSKAKTTAASLHERAGQLGRGVDWRGAKGFTLMEIVVAVGAVALVAVGLAQIFDSVGKTVTGGRRVSVLNTYGGLIETQMRRDFEGMCRDGFLVIRQQSVDKDGDGKVDQTAAGLPPNNVNPDAVPLTSTQPATAWRVRRMDEIMFFAKGKFSSAHEPLDASARASSGLARIYYGHGMRAPLNGAGADAGYTDYKSPHPKVGDRGTIVNAAPFGKGPYDDTNPNAFAADWTVLRQVALMCPPRASDTTTLSGQLFDLQTNADREYFLDQETQIGLSPAMSSVFRASAEFYPEPNDNTQTPNSTKTFRQHADIDGAAPNHNPSTASGVVDIIASDINEVRATITSGGSFAVPPVTTVPHPRLAPFEINNFNLLPMIPLRVFPQISDLYGSGQYGQGRLTHANASDPNGFDTLDYMQAWMSDAMPTESRNARTITLTQDFAPDPADVRGRAVGSRVRYEPQASDLLASMNYPSGAASPLSEPNKLKRAEARGDQEMLASGIFVPHCSEFIVEWSYGDVDASGLVVWFGPTRRIDTNGNGQVDAGDAVAVRPYPFDMNGQAHQKAFHVGNVYDANGNVVVPTPQVTIGSYTAKYGEHYVTDRLIYGFTPTGNEACLTSYFGWTDPTYDPSDSNSPGGPQLPRAVGANSPSLAPGQKYLHSATTLPWAWPRMVRVTITLSDPLNPEIESTFQYIFNTPQDAGATGAASAGSSS